jgi:phosphinothricin acetyltransferase
VVACSKGGVRHGAPEKTRTSDDEDFHALLLSTLCMQCTFGIVPTDPIDRRSTPMTAFIIRSAAPGDLDAITGIYAHAVLHGTASFEEVAPELSEMRRRFDAVVSAGYPYLVTERAGIVIGYAYAGAYRARPAYRWSVENSIYVAPDAHRCGAGRELLDALIAQCTARGARQMIAVIGDSANAASIGLHRRAGFIFCGTIHAVGFKHGRWLDSFIMQRTLGAGDETPPL